MIKFLIFYFKEKKQRKIALNNAILFVHSYLKNKKPDLVDFFNQLVIKKLLKTILSPTKRTLFNRSQFKTNDVLILFSCKEFDIFEIFETGNVCYTDYSRKLLALIIKLYKKKRRIEKDLRA